MYQSKNSSIHPDSPESGTASVTQQAQQVSPEINYCSSSDVVRKRATHASEDVNYRNESEYIPFFNSLDVGIESLSEYDVGIIKAPPGELPHHFNTRDLGSGSFISGPSSPGSFPINGPITESSHLVAQQQKRIAKKVLKHFQGPSHVNFSLSGHQETVINCLVENLKSLKIYHPRHVQLIHTLSRVLDDGDSFILKNPRHWHTSILYLDAIVNSETTSVKKIISAPCHVSLQNIVDRWETHLANDRSVDMFVTDLLISVFYRLGDSFASCYLNYCSMTRLFPGSFNEIDNFVRRRIYVSTGLNHYNLFALRHSFTSSKIDFSIEGSSPPRLTIVGLAQPWEKSYKRPMKFKSAFPGNTLLALLMIPGASAVARDVAQHSHWILAWIPWLISIVLVLYHLGIGEACSYAMKTFKSIEKEHFKSDRIKDVIDDIKKKEKEKAYDPLSPPAYTYGLRAESRAPSGVYDPPEDASIVPKEEELTAMTALETEGSQSCETDEEVSDPYINFPHVFFFVCFLTCFYSWPIACFIFVSVRLLMNAFLYIYQHTRPINFTSIYKNSASHLMKTARMFTRIYYMLFGFQYISTTSTISSRSFRTAGEIETVIPREYCWRLNVPREVSVSSEDFPGGSSSDSAVSSLTGLLPDGLELPNYTSSDVYQIVRDVPRAVFSSYVIAKNEVKESESPFSAIAHMIPGSEVFLKASGAVACLTAIHHLVTKPKEEKFSIKSFAAWTVIFATISMGMSGYIKEGYDENWEDLQGMVNPGATVEILNLAESESNGATPEECYSNSVIASLETMLTSKKEFEQTEVSVRIRKMLGYIVAQCALPEGSSKETCKDLVEMVVGKFDVKVTFASLIDTVVWFSKLGYLTLKTGEYTQSLEYMMNCDNAGLVLSEKLATFIDADDEGRINAVGILRIIDHYEGCRRDILSALKKTKKGPRRVALKSQHTHLVQLMRDAMTYLSRHNIGIEPFVLSLWGGSGTMKTTTMTSNFLPAIASMIGFQHINIGRYTESSDFDDDINFNTTCIYFDDLGNVVDAWLKESPGAALIRFINKNSTTLVKAALEEKNDKCAASFGGITGNTWHFNCQMKSVCAESITRRFGYCYKTEIDPGLMQEGKFNIEEAKRRFPDYFAQKDKTVLPPYIAYRRTRYTMDRADNTRFTHSVSSTALRGKEMWIAVFGHVREHFIAQFAGCDRNCSPKDYEICHLCKNPLVGCDCDRHLDEEDFASKRKWVFESLKKYAKRSTILDTVALEENISKLTDKDIDNPFAVDVGDEDTISDAVTAVETAESFFGGDVWMPKPPGWSIAESLVAYKLSGLEPGVYIFLRHLSSWKIYPMFCLLYPFVSSFSMGFLSCVILIILYFRIKFMNYCRFLQYDQEFLKRLVHATSMQAVKTVMQALAMGGSALILKKTIARMSRVLNRAEASPPVVPLHEPNTLALAKIALDGKKSWELGTIPKTITEIPGGTTLEQLANLVKFNTVEVSTSGGNAKGIFLRPTLMVIPAHLFTNPDGKTASNQWVDTLQIKMTKRVAERVIHLSRSECFIEGDLAFFSCTKLQRKKDLMKHIIPRTRSDMDKRTVRRIVADGVLDTVCVSDPSTAVVKYNMEYMTWNFRVISPEIYYITPSPPSQPGECMAPMILDSKPTIIGLHVLGNAESRISRPQDAPTAGAQPLDQQLLSRAEKWLLQNTSYIQTTESSPLDLEFRGKQYPIIDVPHHLNAIRTLDFKVAEVEYHGSLPTKCSPRNTTLPTTCFKHVNAIVGPAFEGWKPRNQDRMAAPMKMLSLSTTPTPSIDEKLLDHCIKDFVVPRLPLVSAHMGKYPEFPWNRLLTTEEAINGVDGFFGCIQDSKAAGTLEGGKSKNLFVTHNGRKYLQPDLHEDYLRGVCKITEGVDPGWVDRVSHKSECCEVEPEEPTKNSRLITVHNKFSQIEERRAFSGINHLFSTQNVEFETAMGLDLHGPEWDPVMRRFSGSARQPTNFATDYSAYDHIQLREMRSGVSKGLLMFLEHMGMCEEDLRYAMMVCSLWIYGYIQVEDAVVDMARFFPSGNLLTALLNALQSGIIKRYSFYSNPKCPRVIGEFNKHVTTIGLGDDDLNNKFGHAYGWGPSDLFLTVHNLNMQVTDASKRADLEHLNELLQPLGKTTFLKSTPYWNPDLERIVGVRGPRSVLRPLYWRTDAKEALPIYMKAVLQCIMDELFFHGKRVFEHFRPKFLQLARICEVPVDWLEQQDYEDYVDKHFSEECCGTQCPEDLSTVSPFEEEYLSWKPLFDSEPGTDVYYRMLENIHLPSLCQSFTSLRAEANTEGLTEGGSSEEGYNVESKAVDEGVVMQEEKPIGDVIDNSKDGDLMNTYVKAGTLNITGSTITTSSEDWTVKGGDSGTAGWFQPHSFYFKDPAIKARILGNVFYRSNMTVTGKITTSAGNYGKLIVSIHKRDTPATYPVEYHSDLDLMFCTSIPHCVVDIQEQEDFEVVVPWVSPVAMLPMEPRSHSQMPYLRVSLYSNSVEHSLGYTIPVFVEFRVRATDLTLAGVGYPTGDEDEFLGSDILQAEAFSGSKFPSEPPSKFIAAAGEGLGMLSTAMPSLAPASVFISSIANFARSLGYSKNINNSVMNVVPAMSSPMCNSDTDAAFATSISLFEKQEVTMDPGAAGDSDEDGLFIERIATTWSTISRKVWTHNTSREGVLFETFVTPRICVHDGAGHCGYARCSEPAIFNKFANCTMEYEFEFIHSTTHSGTVLIYYKCTDRDSANEEHMLRCVKMNLRNASVVKMNIEWQCPFPLISPNYAPSVKPHWICFKPDDAGGHIGDPPLYMPRACHNGVLGVRVETPLIGQGPTQEAKCTMIVRARCGPGAIFGVPDSKEMERASIRSYLSSDTPYGHMLNPGINVPIVVPNNPGQSNEDPRSPPIGNPFCCTAPTQSAPAPTASQPSPTGQPTGVPTGQGTSTTQAPVTQGDPPNTFAPFHPPNYAVLYPAPPDGTTAPPTINNDGTFDLADDDFRSGNETETSKPSTSYLGSFVPSFFTKTAAPSAANRDGDNPSGSKTAVPSILSPTVGIFPSSTAPTVNSITSSSGAPSDSAPDGQPSATVVPSSVLGHASPNGIDQTPVPSLRANPASMPSVAIPSTSTPTGTFSSDFPTFSPTTMGTNVAGKEPTLPPSTLTSYTSTVGPITKDPTVNPTTMEPSLNPATMEPTSRGEQPTSVPSAPETAIPSVVPSVLQVPATTTAPSAVPLEPPIQPPSAAPTEGVCSTYCTEASSVWLGHSPGTYLTQRFMVQTVGGYNVTSGNMGFDDAPLFIKVIPDPGVHSLSFPYFGVRGVEHLEFKGALGNVTDFTIEHPSITSINVNFFDFDDGSGESMYIVDIEHTPHTTWQRFEMVITTTGNTTVEWFKTSVPVGMGCRFWYFNDWSGWVDGSRYLEDYDKSLIIAPNGLEWKSFKLPALPGYPLMHFDGTSDSRNPVRNDCLTGLPVMVLGEGMLDGPRNGFSDTFDSNLFMLHHTLSAGYGNRGDIAGLVFMNPPPDAAEAAGPVIEMTVGNKSDVAAIIPVHLGETQIHMRSLMKPLVPVCLHQGTNGSVYHVRFGMYYIPPGEVVSPLKFYMASFLGIRGGMLRSYHLLNEGIMHVMRGSYPDLRGTASQTSGYECRDSRVNPTLTVKLPYQSNTRFFSTAEKFKNEFIETSYEFCVEPRGTTPLVRESLAIAEDTSFVHYTGIPIFDSDGGS